MLDSTFDLFLAFFLLFACSFVSYRTVKAQKLSYSAGLFRNFANIPIVHLFLLCAASPFLIRDKILNLKTSSPRYRQEVDEAAFIGNNQSLVFHSNGCEYAEVMGYEKRVAFTSIEEAKQKGYRPCATCKPI